MSGGFFYIADYAILFDYEKIDGIVEKIWQGPVHIHRSEEHTSELQSPC